MRWTYDEALTRGVFPHEGGYTNDAADPGGPTNWGITIFDARKYWKANATAADVKAMPKAVAEDIYAKHYAAPLFYNALPAGVDYSILDYGINSGIGRAGKVLRRLVGLPDNTSAITVEVIDAVNKRDPAALIKAINDERLKFLKSLKTWPSFGKGWERRVIEVKALALHFAAIKAPNVLPIVPAPSITPTQPDETMAKGVVPANKGQQGTAAGGVVAGGAVVAQQAHASGIGLSGLLFMVVAVAAIAIAAVLIVRHRSNEQQEAATPGVTPVPVAA